VGEGRPVRSLRRKRATPPPASAVPPLDIEVSGTAYGAVVAIAGELDLATVAQVREAFASEALAHADAVVVDLTEVEFMDSTGLSALLTFESDLKARRRRLAIACPEGAARLVLDVAGVAERLPLYPTRAEAEAAVVG
jgi:anti-sigma B factor antagonist